MRALLVLLVLTGVAAADAKRECRFHNAKVKVVDLGCFDDLKNTEDHTYGTRVCLVRAANKCSGVMWFWNGDLEGAPVLLDDVTCSKSGAVSFFGTHEDAGAIHLMDFTGRIAKRVLRGTFKRGKQTRKVAWKQTRKGEGFDAAARIRAVSRDVCAPGSAP